MSNSQGSFAVIPSFVLEDESLDEGAKILLARISMYSQEGRCWATNKHFADKQKVSLRCIQKWLNQLKKQGYIEIEIEVGGFQTNRNIWLTFDFKKSVMGRTTVHPPSNYSSPPLELQFTQININKHKINKSSSSTPSLPIAPSADDDDSFSFLDKEDRLSDRDKKNLRKYPVDQVKRALAIAKRENAKSIIRYMMTVLKDPDKFSDDEQNLTAQQYLALKHNELIRKKDQLTVAKANEVSIRKEFKMLGWFGPNAGFCSISLKSPLKEIEKDIMTSENALNSDSFPPRKRQNNLGGSR